jgi:hypothetical protein
MEGYDIRRRGTIGPGAILKVRRGRVVPNKRGSVAIIENTNMVLLAFRCAALQFVVERTIPRSRCGRSWPIIRTPLEFVRVVASLIPRELEATPVTERMSSAQLEAIIARGIGGLDPAAADEDAQIIR